jgi:hypothetical protein
VVATAPGGDCPAAEADEDLPAGGVPGAGVVKRIEPPTVASRTNATVRFLRAIFVPNARLVRADRNVYQQTVAHPDL